MSQQPQQLLAKIVIIKGRKQLCKVGSSISPSGGTSDNLSPQTRIVGRPLDFNKHCMVAFGSCDKASNQTDPANGEDSWCYFSKKTLDDDQNNHRFPGSDARWWPNSRAIAQIRKDPCPKTNIGANFQWPDTRCESFDHSGSPNKHFWAWEWRKPILTKTFTKTLAQSCSLKQGVKNWIESKTSCCNRNESVDANHLSEKQRILGEIDPEHGQFFSWQRKMESHCFPWRFWRHCI